VDAQPAFCEAVLRGELVDLGDAIDAKFAGILIPRHELGSVKVGITDQFLSDAETYHERYSSTSYFRMLIERATHGRLKREPSLILDIGSGSGNSVLPCLELFPHAKVLATDLSENLLAILRDHVDPETRSRLAPVCVDAMRAYFVEDSVDLVVGAAVLHHLIDPAHCIVHACRALRPGGIAVFFEPFEGGSAMLRLCYQQILTENNRKVAECQLTPEVAACLNAFVEDFKVRAGTDKSDAIFQRIDDKWLFTRSYFEDVTASLNVSVEIQPLNPSDQPLVLQTRSNLRLALGLSEDNVEAALPGWSWDMLGDFDAAFSRELKRELPTEASVIFTRLE
jgi:SAM-dependent methyltransferase